MILVSLCIQAEDSVGASTAVIQSPSETSSKKFDDSSISIVNVHQISLDTADIEGSGNWLNKRIWYERSQGSFDEIRTLVNVAGDLRIQFSNEVNLVGKKIESFFEIVNFTRGQLDEKFKEILAELDRERKIVGDLSEQERNLQLTIKQEIGAIEQIGNDIKSIGDVDNKIDQTLVQAFKTIDECRDYETKAWNAFKSIGKELDDKKARNIYYEINNYKQNIDQKTTYLKGTLLPYLHNVLVAKIEDNIEKISTTIEQLKNKGLDIQNIMNKSQDEDIAQLHIRDKEAAEIAVTKALEEEQLKWKEASDKAAAKAAQDLAEANKKSFSNVVNHYYDETIGKIVHFFYQAYESFHVDSLHNFFKSYSYPIITYCYKGISDIRSYMHTLVENIMIYFGGKPLIKATINQKIEEKVAEKLEQHVSEKAFDHNNIEKTEVKKENAQIPVATATVTTVSPLIQDLGHASLSDKEHDKSVSKNSSNTKSDTNVVVQSMKYVEEKKSSVHNIYTVFSSMLDLIGTVLRSLYNCIVQFGKVLLSFSTYVTGS
jgi:hypothetical protein